MLSRVIALISDIHGNLEALKAVLNEIQNDDLKMVIILGDLVDYGADSAEVIRTVVELKKTVDVLCIRGNHDDAVLRKDCSRFRTDHGRRNFDQTLKDLDSSGLIKEFEQICRLDSAVGDNIIFCHATPEDKFWGKAPKVPPLCYDTIRFYRSKTDRVVVGGHSHIQGWTVTDSGDIYLNPGSVGQPRNGDPRAQYVISNDDFTEFQFKRVEYDYQTAARKIKDSGRPDFLYIRILFGI